MRNNPIYVRKVDKFGRLVLPKDLCRDLNISEGDNLEITVDGTDVGLRKSPPQFPFTGTAH